MEPMKCVENLLILVLAKVERAANVKIFLDEIQEKLLNVWRIQMSSISFIPLTHTKFNF